MLACLNCHKQFYRQLNEIKNKSNKFCSLKCYWSHAPTVRRRQELAKLANESWRENNPEAVRSRAVSAWLGKHRSAETKAKISRFQKKRLSEHPEYRVMAHLLRNRPPGQPYTSRGQLKLYLEIKSINAEAQLNFPILTKAGPQYFADVAIPSQKLVIEYDGAFWHKDKERDRIRDFNLEADGWKVIHVLENEKRQSDPKAALQAVVRTSYSGF